MVFLITLKREVVTKLHYESENSQILYFQYLKYYMISNINDLNEKATIYCKYSILQLYFYSYKIFSKA